MANTRTGLLLRYSCLFLFSFKDDGDHLDKIVGEADMADQLWTPDTFFVNEASSSFDPDHTFMRITSDGTVLWGKKVRVTFTGVLY